MREQRHIIWYANRWTNLSKTEFDLNPLNATQSDALVGEILQKVQNLPDELRELVARNAEGNPFYVEELIKVLLDDGVILRGADRWQVDASRLGGLRIPPTLTAVLQSRLDSLHPAERVILQRASVVGRMFWDEPLAVMSDDLAPVMVADRLTSLSQRELIYRHHQSAFTGVHEFAFKHAILRDITYESVLKKERRAYHLRVARWIESATNKSGRTAEYYSVIASHYEQAGEAAKAVEYLGHSAERFFQLAEFSDEIEIVDHALALIADNAALDGLRARLLAQKGNIYSEKVTTPKPAATSNRDSTWPIAPLTIALLPKPWVIWGAFSTGWESTTRPAPICAKPIKSSSHVMTYPARFSSRASWAMWPSSPASTPRPCAT